MKKHLLEDGSKPYGDDDMDDFLQAQVGSFKKLKDSNFENYKELTNKKMETLKKHHHSNMQLRHLHHPV